MRREDSPFRLRTKLRPAGDQPEAIRQTVANFRNGARHQVLLGVTGGGKTFVMAHAIQALGLPTLVLSHNKTLAAQLYAEFREFFPENAVEYFISYYDYYQPEAYIPQTDTYIEKDASINEHIDRLRLKATASLLTRKDVIVVASVSCIYNLGNPAEFRDLGVVLEKGRTYPLEVLLRDLVLIGYERNEVDFGRGKFRVKGGVVDIFPSYEETRALRATLEGDEISRLSWLNPVSGEITGETDKERIYPTRHFVATRPRIEEACRNIRIELESRLEELRGQGKLLEAQRLEQRTKYDLEMLLTVGFCHGVENYSRHLSGRRPGERPACLLDYFPEDFLVILDESHATVPQINGMYEGDRSRKQTLVDYGFRLPSALDNRPLKFPEFEAMVPRCLYVSATPGPYEIRKSKGLIVELIVRPTGLVDPEVEIRPTKNQVQELMAQAEEVVGRKERVLVNVLTKRMAEDLCDYLAAKGMNVRYLHSDIDALTRIQILQDLRAGEFDVLIGVNLLREGLDLPEVSLVAVMDADQEGFLRSETTLIQICGRAARHISGRVLLFADQITGSMKQALAEMERRRKKQLEYNIRHSVRPRSIIKEIRRMDELTYAARRNGLALVRDADGLKYASRESLPQIISELKRQMKEAADSLDFETAAALRDKLFELEGLSPRRPGARKQAAAARRR